ncbi:hypothetical protein [Desulfonatronum sp. SC1]|uniref:hypothetical protein n=1 Tax=Desulfonatronum sp. SC1 TaxID=2109626 RepID=UPI000D2FF5C7|nr:hypothetical protein [Desulfonatronum sp. SC1]PTN38646.1 hypothetical protein C6366_01525 [Desulfonatronum sp. SC1]
MPFGVNRDAAPWEGLLRALGMVFVFMGVIWLFWKHNQRTIEMLDSHQVVVDRGGLLTDAQKQSVRDLSRALKSSFGLDLRLVVSEDGLTRPQVDAKTIHIGIDPESEVFHVVLPPIVERALGQGFIRYLGEEHFAPYWASGNWQRGLGEALSLLWNALSSPEDEYGEYHHDKNEGPPGGGSYRGVVRDEGPGK